MRYLTYKNLWLVILFVNYSKQFDYCSVSCNGAPHTVCNRQHDCSYDDRCNTVYEKILTAEERHVLLSRINFHRNRISLGLFGNPKASNMLEIVWKTELEYIARCWSNSCIMEHDQCRITQDKIDVGQNMIVLDKRYDKISFFTQLQIAVDQWFHERKQIDLDKNFVTSYPNTNGVATNFTQLIWAETQFVGCARTIFAPDGESTSNFTQIFCNFEPAGNIIQEEVYKIGEPCQECQSYSVCHKVHKGLCRTQSFSHNLNLLALRSLANPHFMKPDLLLLLLFVAPCFMYFTCVVE